MTALAPTPVSPVPASVRASSAAAPLRALAGAALLLGPALFAGGMATSPQQDSAADADYIASLARDTTLTEVSALLLHYGIVAIGLGVLAAATLVRGPRGARVVLVGSVLTALGFVNNSGAILADWWNMNAGRQLPADQAVELFRSVKGADLLVLWTGTEPLSLLGPVLVFVGLARAGVLRWWATPLYVLGVVAMFAVSIVSPVAGGALVLVAFAPFALVGLRLLARSRAGL